MDEFEPMAEVWVRRHADILVIVTKTSPSRFEIDVYAESADDLKVDPMSSLEAAKEAADTLVREQLHHVCGNVCDVWEPLARDV